MAIHNTFNSMTSKCIYKQLSLTTFLGGKYYYAYVYRGIN